MMAKDVVDVYLKGNAIGKKQEEDNQIIFGDF